MCQRTHKHADSSAARGCAPTNSSATAAAAADGESGPKMFVLPPPAPSNGVQWYDKQTAFAQRKGGNEPRIANNPTDVDKNDIVRYQQQTILLPGDYLRKGSERTTVAVAPDTNTSQPANRSNIMKTDKQRAPPSPSDVLTVVASPHSRPHYGSFHLVVSARRPFMNSSA